MKPLLFCASCGHRLPSPVDGGSTCLDCGRTWYRNAAPTAGAVIVKGREALVTVRARDPESGRIDVPGGFLAYDERPVDGLKREIDEELGIEIDVSDEDYVQAVPHEYGEPGTWVLAIGFSARYVAGEPSPADDVAEVRWVTLDEVENLDFAWEHDRDLVRRVLQRVEQEAKT